LAACREAEAIGINDAGLAVGFSSLPLEEVDGTIISPTEATLWSGGVATDLGRAPGSVSSQAFRINDVGQVVGESAVLTAGGGISEATLWSGGVPTVLSGIPSAANAINNAGQVVGYSLFSGDSNIQATLWSGGVATNLGALVPGSIGGNAHDINDREQVVGESYFSDSIEATLLSRGVATDLGRLPGFTRGVPYAINDAGGVVGLSGNDSGPTEATLWSGGMVTDLGHVPGTVGSVAFAINDAGQAVGRSDFEICCSYHATLWIGGVAIDLNTVLDSSGIGWTLWFANGVNTFGQIVGFGTNPSGEPDAFLLTPCPTCEIVETLPPPPSGVPETSTWMMMLIGFAGLGFAGHRRARGALRLAA
jgi:probable HAF family extracellular repeat protein